MLQNNKKIDEYLKHKVMRHLYTNTKKNTNMQLRRSRTGRPDQSRGSKAEHEHERSRSRRKAK